jgi:hypothetical protein
MGETGATLQRHQWNTAFTWQDTIGPFRRVTDDQAAQFNRDGYVVMEGLIDEETLAAATKEIDHHEEKVEAFPGPNPTSA